MQRFSSNGKLLLSGEYLILDGALGLSLPTHLGQDLIVKSDSKKEGILNWKSFDHLGNLWFQMDLIQADLKVIEYQGKEEVASTLKNILSTAKKANSNFLNSSESLQVETHLQFPQNWGLGSSSTLINNIGQWSKTNAFDLLFNSFGGSGYDIASAKYDQPVFYQLIDGVPKAKPADFNPVFKDFIYFVYLNKKQISRDSIRSYKELNVDQESIDQISDITIKISQSQSLTEFNALIERHESLISGILQVPTVQKKLFPDFEGQTKSLGAWGGDFILATGDDSTRSYFEKKGFETVVPYTSMIRNS